MKINMIDFKVDDSKLSHTKRKLIDSIFKQSKYLTNDIISSGDAFLYDTKVKDVPVVWFDSDKVIHEDIRSLECLPEQVKQQVKVEIISNLKTLSSLKKKGYKTGKLKFRTEIQSVTFNQFGCTWAFPTQKDLRKHSPNTIRLALLGFINVTGFENEAINGIVEWGPAKLCRRPDGLYIQCIGFSEKKESKAPTGSVVGIDMGIKDQIVLSTGEKYNFSPNEETKRLKRLNRIYSKKVKRSANYWKAKRKFQKKHQKVSNRKKDVTDKFVHGLQQRFETICIQDENLKGWQSSLFGKAMTHGVLGRIKSRLQESNTTRVVHKRHPTTKLCPVCGSKNASNNLADRTYLCESCGFTMDRDTKSAQTIACMGLVNDFLVPTERRDIKPVESLASVLELYSALYASR